MLNDHYNYYVSKNKTRFFFESIGKQGTITKVIEFRQRETERWSLAFGDWHNGKVDDSVITNNHDVAKVMGTIAETVFEFFGEYPNATLLIHPIDDKRKKLYNAIFQRRLKELEPMFDIFGSIENQLEVFSSEKLYDSFEIKRKFGR